MATKKTIKMTEEEFIKTLEDQTRNVLSHLDKNRWLLSEDEYPFPLSHQKALALAGYISRMEVFVIGQKEWAKIHKRAKIISTLVRRGK